VVAVRRTPCQGSDQTHARQSARTHTAAFDHDWTKCDTPAPAAGPAHPSSAQLPPTCAGPRCHHFRPRRSSLLWRPQRGATAVFRSANMPGQSSSGIGSFGRVHSMATTRPCPPLSTHTSACGQYVDTRTPCARGLVQWPGGSHRPVFFLTPFFFFLFGDCPCVRAISSLGQANSPL